MGENHDHSSGVPVPDGGNPSGSPPGGTSGDSANSPGQSHATERAPTALLGRGVQEEGTTVLIEVRACLGKDGRLWSTHDTASPEDTALLNQMPGGGHRMVAHALLTEAIRREAFVCLLVALSRDNDLLSGWAGLNDERKSEITRNLANEVGKVLAATMGPMVLPSVQEALAMIGRG